MSGKQVKKTANRPATGTKKKTPLAKKPSPEVEALQEELRKCKTEILMLRGKFNMDEIKKSMKGVIIEEVTTESLLQETIYKLEAELREYKDANGNGGADSINDLREKLLKVEDEKKTNENVANDRINGLRKQIESLTNDYSKVKTENDNMKGKLPDVNEYRSTETSLKQTITELKAKLKFTEDKLKTYIDQLPDIHNKSSNEDLKNLRVEFDKEKKKNNQLSQDLEEIKGNLEEMTKDRSERIAKINQLNESLRDTEKMKSDLQSELANCKEKCDRLTKQISTNDADDTVNDFIRKEDILRQELREKEDSIYKLHGEIQKSKEELTKLKDDHAREITELKKQFRNQSEEELSKLKDDHAITIQKLNQQFSADSSKMHKDLTEARSQQASSNHGDQEAQTLRKQLEEEKKAHEKTKSEKSDLENKCHEAFENINKKDKEMKHMEKTLKEAINKKDTTINELRREKSMVDPTGGNSRAELNELKRENDQLKTRLSKMAGDQLMNNNPNITDLSDENRPTKLSEKYSELYDNEWTDAFEDEENESGSEEKAVKSLYKMLLDVHKFCQKESKDHSDRLKKFVRSISSSSTESKDQPDIPVTKLRQLKEIRKSFAADMVESVAEKYIKTKNPSIKGKPNTEKYIRRCVELCWLMSVQDPPVLINDKLTSGLLDGDSFRTYTKTGKTIDFVVWPPLLLHENGPLLCKGVAQGK